MTQGDRPAMDVDSFVDCLKVNGFHISVLILCTLLTAIDGYEIYVVGWVLPDLARDFGVPRTAITSAMIAQQIGMVVGAFLIPPLADRIGRPRMLLLCYAGMAIAALGILTTQSLTPFALWRFVAGVCGTAMIPILVTLASETAPARLRSTFSTITVCGTMIGALGGAAMQAFVLEPFGWRGAFWIAAALPAISLPFIWLFLPESLRSLAARNPADPAIARLARRMQPAGADPVTLVASAREQVARRAGRWTEILGPGMRLKSVLMWGIATSSFLYIAAGQWKTTIFKDVIGLGWQQVAAVNATNTTAGILGMFLIGFFIDRFGFRRVMVSAFLLAALGTVLTGLLAPAVSMYAAVILMATFQHGGQASMAALAAALYPPSHRATGVGWTYGVARILTIPAPLFGNIVLGSGLDGTQAFALLALPLVSAALLTLWLMSLPGAPQVSRRDLRHG